MKINPFDTAQVESLAALHGRRRYDALNCQVKSSYFVKPDIRCSVSLGFTDFLCNFIKQESENVPDRAGMSLFHPTCLVPEEQKPFSFFAIFH